MKSMATAQVIGGLWANVECGIVGIHAGDATVAVVEGAKVDLDGLTFVGG